jgi:hypothetical protein
MNKLYSAVLVVSFLFFNSVSAEEVFPFENIMKLMHESEITYERIGHYKRPFKVIKKSDNQKTKWYLKQMKNLKQSRIWDKGDNKIKVNGFPDGWTVNGTWLFTKSNNECRIDHTGGGMVMRWNCDG